MKVCLLNESFPPVIDGVVNVMMNYAKYMMCDFGAKIEVGTPEYPDGKYSEYQIRISHLDGKDSMRIYVETSGSNDFKALQQQVAAAVKSKIGFTPIVYVVELGFLPRSEKKSKRVIDERFQ